jgi:thioredoxin:protein disulfide reductase
VQVVKLISLYLILLWSSMAQAFVSEVDDGHPFELYFDDDVVTEVSKNQAEVDFLFRIPEKHRLYRETIRIELDSEDVNFVVETPAGIIKYDDFFEKETEVYHDQLAVLLKVKFKKQYDFSVPLTGTIYYQGCSDKICFRTMKEKFSLALKVSSKSTNNTLIHKVEDTNKEASSIFSLLKSNQISSVLEKGLAIALLIAFLAGLLTCFTPCVLPIIPLTLTFIGVGQGESKSKRLQHLAIFVFGLAIMYTFLGVLSAYLGKTLGFLYQNSFFLLVLVLFFAVMGLWMLGVFKFNVSAKFQNKIVQYQPKGFLKYLYAGLTIGFLAAPCVGPILGPILVYISTTQDIMLGTLLMLSYSIGFSVLFFILGFFSRGWIASFGEKSNWVKKIIGVLLIIVSVYYASIVVKPWFGTDHDDGFFVHNYAQAEKLAKQSQKGILIDFYADWCLPCHEWDDNVWSQKDVQAKLNQDFIALKIDCTTESDECKQAIEKFRIIGWPTILFLDKNLKEYSSKRIVGSEMDSKEFLEYLEEVK